MSNALHPPAHVLSIHLSFCRLSSQGTCFLLPFICQATDVHRPGRVTSGLPNLLTPVSERTASLHQVRKPQRGVSKSGCRYLVLANQFLLNSKPRAMQLFLCPWEERTRPRTSDIFQQNIYTRPSAVCQRSAMWPERH